MALRIASLLWRLVGLILPEFEELEPEGPLPPYLSTVMTTVTVTLAVTATTVNAAAQATQDRRKYWSCCIIFHHVFPNFSILR